LTDSTAAPRQRDPLAGRLPVTIITGFLGSGKTTLLRRLLRHPAMNRAAVIINEFGDVGLDHELVEASSEQMTLLSNGCLCCTVRTDLQETLRELFVKRRSGEIIDFDRVFVETTGLADPVPVLHTLQTDGLLGAQYRLNGVVTLVDAVNGMGQLDTMAEAAKQAAVADRLVITKTDIADASQVDGLERRLSGMNPYAKVSQAVEGELDPEVLAEITPGNAQALARDPDRWLALHAGGADSASPVRGRFGAGAHDAAIHSFCLWFDAPFTWDTLSAAIDMLTSLRGPDLLRVKGIVNVEGEPGPVAIHGAQHVFHPPVKLAEWKDDDRRSRIVFIVRSIPREAIEAVFTAAGLLRSGAP
jgi:G3E family GTPase